MAITQQQRPETGRSARSRAGGVARKNRQPRSLVQFFRESPFVGMELKFERSQDTGRKIE